jgi:Leucine-rich repeat (LRR) protein
MKFLSGIEVFECKKLKHLDLSYNQISLIDDGIINLENLEVLNL